MIIRVPFQGFYNTLLQDDLDTQVEYYNLDEESINWLATREAVAEEYAKEWLHQKGLWGKFDSLVSPREYNFDTDALLIKFTPAALLEIKTDALRDNHGEFQGWVLENCKSYGGFFSYLPHNLNEWPKEWSERHYCAALEFLDEGGEDIIGVLRANGQMEIITRSDNS
jgi:hypothetical protein